MKEFAEAVVAAIFIVAMIVWCFYIFLNYWRYT